MLAAYYLSRSISLNPQQKKSVAEAIKQLLPCEISSVYYDEDSGKGILNNKIDNVQQKMRKQNQLQPSTRTVKKERELNKAPAAAEPKKRFTGSELSSDDYVKTNAMDSECAILQSHWKQSHQIRMHFVDSSHLTDVLNEYKAYSRPDGMSLVSLWKNLFHKFMFHCLIFR